MIQAVLDANALVSGIVRIRVADSPPGEVFRRWRADQFALIVSAHIISEVRRTFRKPYLMERVPPVDVEDSLLVIQRRALIVAVTVTVSGVATHPEDDLVLAAAVSTEADFLVTGDRQLLKLGQYEGVRIVSPREFLAILDNQSDELDPPTPATPRT